MVIDQHKVHVLKQYTHNQLISTEQGFDLSSSLVPYRILKNIYFFFFFQKVKYRCYVFSDKNFLLH